MARAAGTSGAGVAAPAAAPAQRVTRPIRVVVRSMIRFYLGVRPITHVRRGQAYPGSMKGWVGAWAFAMVLMTSGVAPGQELPSQGQTPTVHAGPYFRLMLGAGYASVSQDRDGGETSLHGLGLALDV